MLYLLIPISPQKLSWFPDLRRSSARKVGGGAVFFQKKVQNRTILGISTAPTSLKLNTEDISFFIRYLIFESYWAGEILKASKVAFKK